MHETEREYITETADLPGRAGSYWISSTEPKAFAPLGGETLDVDVAIVGAGIVGILTADRLARSGRTVALLEMRRVCGDVTGHTTAKLTAQHGARYRDIVRHFGEDGARAYAAAQTEAIRWVRETAPARGIECDLAEADAWLYATPGGDSRGLEREAEAQARAGLDVEVTGHAPVPFEVDSAVRLRGQARFHPLRFLLPIAESLPGVGCRVCEGTRVTRLSDGDTCEIRTSDEGTVRASAVVVATHYPMMDKVVFAPRLFAMRSYVLGVRLDGDVPEGMHYPFGEGMSLRPQPLEDGGAMLLVTGQDHKAGQGGDERECYRGLEAWARENLPVRSVEYRWSTQDNHTDDGLPYVGAYPGKTNVYVATGFHEWGMTNGVAASALLAGMIEGKPDSERVALFDPSRLKPAASISEFAKQNLNVASSFIAQRVGVPHLRSPAEVERGEGRVAEVEGRKTAVHRSSSGELHAISPTCVHLGCVVEYNEAEATWDCPCHGSRYWSDGEALHGPADRALAPVDVHEAAPSR